jgi:argininosuccinate lyase
MHDTEIYCKYFCKGEITAKDVADYIAQWLPDFRRTHENVTKLDRLGKEWGVNARKDLSDNIESNKSVTGKLYNNEPLNSDDVKDILIYLESAQRSMHQLLPNDKVIALDKYIDNLKDKDR